MRPNVFTSHRDFIKTFVGDGTQAQQLSQWRRRQQLPTKFHSGRAAVVSKFLARSGGAASPVMVATLIKAKDLMHCGASGGEEEG